MSYLTLPKGIPNFSKAVISLWFRVPKASIEAAAAEEIPPAYTFILPYTIPLLTFGKPLTAKRLQGNVQQVATYHYTVFDIATGATVTPPIYEGPYAGVFGPVYDSITFSNVADDPIDVCYIGLYCETGKAYLRFNIQLESTAALTGFAQGIKSQDFYKDDEHPPEYDATLGSGWAGAGVKGISHTVFVDTSASYNNKPEFFQVNCPTAIAADQWHHLLLSFDLSRSCDTDGPPLPATAHEGARFWDNAAQGTTKYCKLWYAIDDVDYRGRAEDYATSVLHNLGPYSVDYDLSGTTEAMGDPNGILSYNAWQVAISGSSWSFNCAFGPASCRYTPEPIPSNDWPAGIPGSVKFVDHIYRVEMAELQLFTGVTLDTEIEKNRRAFVDMDGKPVPPDKQKDPDDPTSRSGSIELLGKEPEILLHGSGDWQSGKNTGTLGMEVSPEGEQTIIPAGQFVPTAKIEPYKPEPALTETP